VFCDSLGNVYRVQPGAPEPEMVVKTAVDPILVKRDSGDDLLTAMVCPSKQGFVLYAVNQSCQLTVIIIDIIIIFIIYIIRIILH